MSEKQMSARVMNLCLTEAEWSTNYANFIPKKGELVIYDSDSTNTVRRFKFGDGIKTVNELPFQDTNISNSKSGSAILIDDISPITHNMGVNVRSKNLIPYPYYNFSLEQNGVTATLRNDGSITLNGTATENVAFRIYDNTHGTKKDFIVKPGIKYTVSGIPNGALSTTYYLRITTINDRAHDFADNSYTQQFNITEDTAVKWVFVTVKKGVTVNNVVFKPQLELGTTATAYTPYVPDLTAVKVKKQGKNLIPYPYLNSTKTIAGITFTVNSDGTITANGTAEVNGKATNAYFEITSISTFYIPRGNYILSGCPSGGSSTTYNLAAVNGRGASYTKFRQDIGNGITLSSSGEYWIITCRIMGGQTVENLTFKPQLELGTTATDYEPYIAPTEYTPNADGTVEGVTSLYPNTTLMTDTDGVLIDCEYLTKNYKYILDNRIPKQVQSANKLTTPRSISITGGVNSTATNFDGSQNISIPITSIKESYLSWGGKNFLASFGPLDAAMIPELNANRFAFMDTSAIEVQYSIDGGNTWSTYVDNNLNTLKSNLFNGNLSGLYIGGSNSTNIDKSNHQLRIIITTDIAKLYTSLNKFCIYCSTSGSNGSWCTIDAKTHSDVVSNSDAWTVFADRVSIGGWSGYNIINTAGFTTYSNTDSQYQKIRFTFGVTSHPSTTGYGGLCISKIMGFGGVGWQTPSEMARTGRMYTYDSGGNVTFPAGLTAKAFSGSLSGNAETATKLKNSRNIKTNLSSTNGANFNGEADITPGVTGTLGIANGGTGATTAAGARTNLGLVAITNDEIDSICV